MKSSSSRTRKFSPLRSSITTRTTGFTLKRPLKCILRVQGCHHPSYFMVWWEVSHQGVTHLHFCKKGVKLIVYQEDVLQGVVKHLNMTLFSCQEWILQQDSFPAQKAKTTQEQLRRNVPGFISTENWPLGSPDLNPLDYKLWAVLEDMAC